MWKKILSFLRVVPTAACVVVAVSGMLGVGLQAIAVVVLVSAYHRDWAHWLRRAWAEEHVPIPQSKEGRSLSAFHEAGHAVVGWVLPCSRKPYLATIRQDGNTNGHVRWRALTSDPVDLETAINEIAMCFGGFAAEKEFGLAENGGKDSDLEQATDIATRMVCEWGFSGKLAHRRYDIRSGLMTPELRTTINAEIDRFMLLGEERALKTAKAHREAIGRLAALLLEHETLTERQIRDAMESAPAT